MTAILFQEDDSGNIVYNFTLSSKTSGDGVIGQTDGLAIQFLCTYPSKTLVLSSVDDGVMYVYYIVLP